MSHEKIFFESGKRIAELRRGMTQAEFAAKLGVDRKTIVRWEAGERLPDGVSLLALTREFNADINYILTGQRSAPVVPVLAPDEAALLDNYRNCPQEGKQQLERSSALYAQLKKKRA